MAGESRGVRAFTCKQCGAPVKVRAAGVSLSAVCPACKSVVDVNDPSHKVLSAFQGARQKTIPLGQQGVFEGQRFTVLAFLVREPVDAPSFQWEEYLLFHPLKGYRWLVQSDGHWSWVTPIKKQPRVNRRFATLAGTAFRLFSKGSAKVVYAEGELYWRVEAGETVEVEDYVAPPLMLSREAVGTSEVTWSRGEYMKREDVAAALDIDERSLPKPVGIAPNQPSPYGDSQRRLYKTALLLVLALCLLQLGSLVHGLAAGKELLQEGGIHREGQVEPQLTAEFDLPEEAPLEISLTADALRNNWLEAEIVLIDVDRGTQRAFELGVEYYQGVEEGEFWQEGGTRTSRVLPKVAPGRYRLAVTAAAGPTSGGEMPYQVGVKSGAVLFDNFWLALAALLVYPGLVWYRQRSFEKLRWAASTYGGSS